MLTPRKQQQHPSYNQADDEVVFEQNTGMSLCMFFDLQ